MLYTSICNDFDVQTQMDKISILVCLRECRFLKIMSLWTEDHCQECFVLYRWWNNL